MNVTKLATVLPFLVLSACDDLQLGTSVADGQILRTLPEGVAEIARPDQDLTAVRISPIDGCYEFRHIGPVETTFLPLTSTKGQPICSRPKEQEEAEPVATTG